MDTHNEHILVDLWTGNGAVVKVYQDTDSTFFVTVRSDDYATYAEAKAAQAQYINFLRN